MKERHFFLLACLVVIGLASRTLAQPVGPEFRVNTHTTGSHEHPSVASDASGDFVVVWDSTAKGVIGQRFDSDGNRLGGEFRVKSAGEYPSVASAASGNFVVVWHGVGYVYVYGQRYDSDGRPLGGDFQVNHQMETKVSVGGVASDASGDFVVVWSSAGKDGDSYGVAGQRFDSNGIPLGGEFQVNTYTTASQSASAVASDASGNFVVAWSGAGQNDDSGVFGQRYDSDGNPLGEEFQVDTVTDNAGVPSVASDANGNFVIVWQENSGVFGQRYDSDGRPLGSEFQVSTYVTGDQRYPSVSCDASGNFVVVWENYDYGSYRRSQSSAQMLRSRPVRLQPSGVRAESFADRPVGPLFDEYGIYGQRFDNEGNRVGKNFQVNTLEDGPQDGAAVSLDPSGTFLVAWTRSVFPSGDRDVFGRLFSAGCKASVQARGVHTPGSAVPVQVHIAHHRPKTVTVPWELRLLDADGQRIARRKAAPHTFEPGDVVDKTVEFRLPNDLADGTYTLELAITGMAGTKGATTTLRVVRAE